MFSIEEVYADLTYLANSLYFHAFSVLSHILPRGAKKNYDSPHIAFAIPARSRSHESGAKHPNTVNLRTKPRDATMNRLKGAEARKGSALEQRRGSRLKPDVEQPAGRPDCCVDIAGRRSFPHLGTWGFTPLSRKSQKQYP